MLRRRSSGSSLLKGEKPGQWGAETASLRLSSHDSYKKVEVWGILSRCRGTRAGTVSVEVVRGREIAKAQRRTQGVVDVPSLVECRERLGLSPGRVDTLPFAPGDVTAGSETELQVAVVGERTDVDLPLTIEQSNYFENIVRRTAVGDTTKRSLHQLEEYLNGNGERVWENSWVRFPRRVLGEFANQTLGIDLRAQKTDDSSPHRSDVHRFFFEHGGEEYVRLPISYLVKLALADAVGESRATAGVVHDTAVRVMPSFLNDNTSPETVSFHVGPVEPSTGNGDVLALGVFDGGTKRPMGNSPVSIS